MVIQEYILYGVGTLLFGLYMLTLSGISFSLLQLMFFDAFVSPLDLNIVSRIKRVWREVVPTSLDLGQSHPSQPPLFRH